MRITVSMLCFATCLMFAGTANAQGRGGFGMLGGGGAGGIFRVAANDLVQKEIALSGDGATKAKNIAEDFQATVRDGMSGITGGTSFQDMSQQEREKFMEKMTALRTTATEKYLPKLKDALNADQFNRVQQINYQLMDTTAYSDAEVIKSLDITKEQQDKIKEVNAALNTKMRDLFQGGGGGGREAFAEFQKERKTKVNAVLTKEQLDKFESLKGKEFAQLSELRTMGRPNR